jgi:hypothetical protein
MEIVPAEAEAVVGRPDHQLLLQYLESVAVAFIRPDYIAFACIPVVYLQRRSILVVLRIGVDCASKKTIMLHSLCYSSN